MEPFHKSAMDIGGCVDLKIAFCGHLEPFGASYDSQSPFRTQKIIPIYCLSYAFTISNLDWRWSTRLEPPNPRMVPRAIFSSFGPYWGPMAPPMAHLTNKTVPMHHHGCAMTSSTLIPHCSTRLEPPDPLMAKKGRFWPHWTLDALWCPWMAPSDPQNCCKAPPRLCPGLFHHPYSKLFHHIVAKRPAYGP